MTRPDDVVAYTYLADLYCPRCILHAVVCQRGIPTLGAGSSTIILAPVMRGERIDVEASLDVAAKAWGIDRWAEITFDSGEFPKVAFRDQIAPGDRCGSCGEELS